MTWPSRYRMWKPPQCLFCFRKEEEIELHAAGEVSICCGCLASLLDMFDEGFAPDRASIPDRLAALVDGLGQEAREARRRKPIPGLDLSAEDLSGWYVEWDSRKTRNVVKAPAADRIRPQKREPREVAHARSAAAQILKEAELEVQERMRQVEQAYQDAIHEGWKRGYEEGLREGRAQASGQPPKRPHQA